MTDLPPAVPPPPPSEPPELRYPSPPPASAADLPAVGTGSLASVGQRGLARVLDLLVVSVPVEIWMFAGGYVDVKRGEVSVSSPGWFAVVTAVLPVLYEFVLIGWRGQTLGKMAMRIRVARFADGGLPTWQQSAFRVLVPAVPQFLGLVLPSSADSLGVVLWALWLGVYLSALADRVLRGLHDKAAGTIVLRTR